MASACALTIAGIPICSEQRGAGIGSSNARRDREVMAIFPWDFFARFDGNCGVLAVRLLRFFARNNGRSAGKGCPVDFRRGELGFLIWSLRLRS